MNKNCARCMKVVYATEEFKCLEKVWHKTCFKCTECNMALNMKTYKGFNKNPYCEAHIPKAKATTIAETPELKRIAENTKIQSNVKYHAEFEKAKGKVTQIADDPETLRIKQNTKNFSNVAYHGDIQKKAQMEKQRELTEIVDNRDNNESEYFSETLAAEVLPHYHHQAPPVSAPEKAQTPPQKISPASSVDATNYMNNNGQQYSSMQPPPPSTNGNKYQQQPPPPTQYNTNGNGNGNLPRSTPVVVQHASIPSGGLSSNQQMQQQLQQKYYDQYEFTRSNGNNYNGMSQSSYSSPQKTAAYAQQQQQSQQQAQMTSSYNQQMNYNNLYNQHQNGIGKISDYDPMTDGPRNVPQAARPNQTLVYSSDRAAILQQQQSQQRRIGSVNEIDPVNGYYGSVQDPYIQQQQQQQQRQYLEQQQRLAAQQQQMLQQQQQQIQQQQQQKSVSKVRVYRALYDYEAQDSDEVSFAEGDLIFEVNSIDAGWMTGRIERTGQIGMLPANYIEQVMI